MKVMKEMMGPEVYEMFGNSDDAEREQCTLLQSLIRIPEQE